MTKVTITKLSEGNDGATEIDARAQAIMAAAQDHAGPIVKSPARSAIATLADEMDRRWTAENAIYERDHTDEEREAAVAHSGAAAHQLMALPATSLADFRAKARAIEWALCGEWDTWDGIGTYSEFAKTLILELIGDTRRRELSSGEAAEPDAPGSRPPARPAAGHAVSDPAPDATTPLGVAVAAREALRAEWEAWDEANDDVPHELEERVAAADLAVFSTPASSVAEIRWKLLEDVMESNALWSHREAEKLLSTKSGLDGASQRGILYDLDAMAELGVPNFAQDRAFLDASAEALDLAEASYALSEDEDHAGAARKRASAEKIISGLLEQRPATLAGVMARARLVDHHAPADVFEDYGKLEWQLVRALVGDIKALFCGRPAVACVGSDEVSALWSAARFAAYTKGDSYPPPPKMAPASARAPELLAAE